MSVKLTSRCGEEGSRKQKTLQNLACLGDVFAASVINQKSISQNAQQILVLVGAQVNNIIEAQFGFSTNDEHNIIGV